MGRDKGFAQNGRKVNRGCGLVVVEDKLGRNTIAQDEEDMNEKKARNKIVRVNKDEFHKKTGKYSNNK